MPGPMQGIKVVEAGMWVAGPAAAGILGDWGAEVVKIEPPEGDPFRALLSGIVDYAGLFPPAGLDMATAVRNYADYRDDDASWMLGRFVAPAAKLDELARQYNLHPLHVEDARSKDESVKVDSGSLYTFAVLKPVYLKTDPEMPTEQMPAFSTIDCSISTSVGSPSVTSSPLML